MAIKLKKRFDSIWDVNDCYTKVHSIVYNDDWSQEIILKYFYNKDIRDNHWPELNRENIRKEDWWIDWREEAYNHLKTIDAFKDAVDV